MVGVRASGQRIGAVAERTGVSVKTIRFYCDQGLLQPVSRSRARYRLFDDSVDDELAMIRTLRALDIPLPMIRSVLEARRSGLCTCARLQGTIRSKSAEITRRIEDLKALQVELTTMLNHWESCGGRSADSAEASPGPSRP